LRQNTNLRLPSDGSGKWGIKRPWWEKGDEKFIGARIEK